MNEYREDAVRRGVEVLTAWLEAKPGVGPDELVWQIIEANVKEGVEAEVQMTLGLLNVASALLVKLAAATGNAEQEILQELALKYGGS